MKTSVKFYKTGYQVLNKNLEVLMRFNSFAIAARYIDKLIEQNNTSYKDYYIFNLKTSKAVQIL